MPAGGIVFGDRFARLFKKLCVLKRDGSFASKLDRHRKIFVREGSIGVDHVEKYNNAHASGVDDQWCDDEGA